MGTNDVLRGSAFANNSSPRLGGTSNSGPSNVGSNDESSSSTKLVELLDGLEDFVSESEDQFGTWNTSADHF